MYKNDNEKNNLGYDTVTELHLDSIKNTNISSGHIIIHSSKK